MFGQHPKMANSSFSLPFISLASVAPTVIVPIISINDSSVSLAWHTSTAHTPTHRHTQTHLPQTQTHTHDNTQSPAYPGCGGTAAGFGQQSPGSLVFVVLGLQLHGSQPDLLTVGVRLQRHKHTHSYKKKKHTQRIRTLPFSSNDIDVSVANKKEKEKKKGFTKTALRWLSAYLEGKGEDAPGGGHISGQPLGLGAHQPQHLSLGAVSHGPLQQSLQRLTVVRGRESAREKKKKGGGIK